MQKDPDAESGQNDSGIVPVADPAERDAAMRRIASVAASVQHFVSAGLFGTYSAAQRRAAKLVEDRKLNRVGDVKIGKTKRTSVFSTRESVANLAHEYWVTNETLFAWETVRRAKDVDAVVKPDATILICGVEVDIEVDLDTEGHEQVKTQMDKYREAGRYNVWFSTSKTRLENIARYSTPLSIFSVLGSGVLYDVSGIEVPVGAILDRARGVAS